MNIYKVLVVCLMSVQPQQFFSGPNDTKLVFLQFLAESEFYRARRLIALKSKPNNLFVVVFAVSKLSFQLHEIVISIVEIIYDKNELYRKHYDSCLRWSMIVKNKCLR